MDSVVNLPHYHREQLMCCETENPVKQLYLASHQPKVVETNYGFYFIFYINLPGKYDGMSSTKSIQTEFDFFSCTCEEWRWCQKKPSASLAVSGLIYWETFCILPSVESLSVGMGCSKLLFCRSILDNITQVQLYQCSCNHNVCLEMVINTTL